MEEPNRERHANLSGVFGDAAEYPARVAVRVWRGRLETAATEMLSAPETARIVDRALAGPLPEELTDSLIRHRVLERVVSELAAAGELERLLDQALASEATRRAIREVASSPEVRDALARQSAGLGEQVAEHVRVAVRRLDARLGRPSTYGGIASRALALAVDALLAFALTAAGGAVAALIGALAGGVRPAWLAGALLAAGWAIVTSCYFVLFWSTTGQTPGMRLLRLRVRRPDGGISLARASIRMLGLALAIIPLFAGFLPALVDSRRRGLPDFLAGTVVQYDDRHDERR